MSLRVCFAVLLITSSLAPAQTRRRPATPAPAKAKTESPSAWPLTELHVTGNHLYTEAAIVDASGLKIGQTVEKKDFEAARDRLIATGAFQTVGFEFGPAASGNGYQGKFEVAEIAQVYRYRFEQLPWPDAELQQVLHSKEPLFGQDIPGTAEVLGRFVRDLNEYAASRSFGDKIIGRLVADRPGELVVVFRPSTPPPSIASVRFTGNEAIPNAVLQRVFGEVAIGVPYSEVRVRELLDANIRPLYEAKGRMRVAFSNLETEPAKGGVKGVSLTVHVEEGPAYQFGTVGIARTVIPSDELLKIAGLKPKQPANFDAVTKAQEALKQRFRKSGYMEMTSTVERKINDADKKVDLVIRIEPGPQYRMGKLDVQGLDLFGEPAVRKLWALKEGSPYDENYPETFLTRIREEGYFDNLGKTRFESKVNATNNTVDVTLYFAGGPPASDKRPGEQQPPP